ncbi:PDZ domain-containing protein [Enterococcus sp. BWT-B8]|uniref:SepM family pheromone-processing serine protease n=1 Tax=unclassified Enterococcus TaxID=2608891 RepID=UPI001E38B1BD|nr:MULTISPECIES: SepM family pheromone-processing serine protease [unclassified Enterococcus]MCB5950772.1 PDZ domain-containing protein [Enterococcus sp. BWT-B8]MCB5955213.1 PDZ domain-containing protein [Enterococcus sp. CWB-B31]
MINNKKKFSFIPFFLILVFILLFVVRIPYYIEGPGSTENLKDFVTVDGKKDEGAGGFYLTTVSVRRATAVSAIVAHFTDFNELLSKEELMGSSTSKEYEQIQQYYMDSSQNAAIEQALRLAGIDYRMEYKGVYVLTIDEESDFKNKIEVGDTVTGVDGKIFENSEELIEYVKSQEVGQKVTVTFLHDGEEKEASGRLMELSTKNPGIGIGLTDHTEIETDVDVRIDAGSIGGPSAGLMFTLQTYELLTGKEIRKGHEIAGTGTINSEGTVGRIGGIDKKVVTASENGAEIFFAPDDEISDELKEEYPETKTNYEEALAAAEKIGTDMKIVPVKTVQDALDYLNELEEK